MDRSRVHVELLSFVMDTVGQLVDLFCSLLQLPELFLCVLDLVL